MLTHEYPQFEAQVRLLEQVFGKSLGDDTVKAYWFALKDQPLEKFKHFVEKHVRRGKFFPKPSELRAKEEFSVERDAKMDADFRGGEKLALQNLEELRRTDEAAWRKEVQLRHLDRMIAITEESHPAYLQILAEWRTARGIPA